MKQQPDWELVDDTVPPKQSFGQKDLPKDFLFALLGKYPRLKLAGLATAGMLMVALITLFSLIALAGATVASVVILFAAWCRTKFSRSKKAYHVHLYGK